MMRKVARHRVRDLLNIIDREHGACGKIGQAYREYS